MSQFAITGRRLRTVVQEMGTSKRQGKHCCSIILARGLMSLNPAEEWVNSCSSVKFSIALKSALKPAFWDNRSVVAE